MERESLFSLRGLPSDNDDVLALDGNRGGRWSAGAACSSHFEQVREFTKAASVHCRDLNIICAAGVNSSDGVDLLAGIDDSSERCIDSIAPFEFILSDL